MNQSVGEEAKKIKANKFFKFLFEEKIFQYWNVDIPTARKIGKSKAMALMMVYWISQNDGFAGLAMRDSSIGLKESVIPEIFWALEELNIEATYKLGDKELHFKNGNIIYFKGAQTKTLSQATLTGFAPSYKVTRWIVWLEEVYQFTPKQFSEIGQAIRGAPKTIFATSNPWLPDNWYVEMIEEIQPFARPEDQHYKIGEYISDTERRLVVQGDVYNSPFLSDEDIAQLINDCKAQPYMYNPVIRGLPGILTGAIYAHLLEKTKYIEPSKNDKIDNYYVGIDFGEISDSTSIVLIASYNGYKTIRVLEEFEYDPRQGRIERDDIAILVHNQIYDWTEKYKIGYLQCRYDNSAVVFGEKLKSLAKYSSIIFYKPCIKKLINDRIDIVTMFMAEGRIIFNKNIDKLYRELQFSRWKNNKNGLIIKEREDGNDHMINAFEYAIEIKHKNYHQWIKHIKIM